MRSPSRRPARTVLGPLLVLLLAVGALTACTSEDEEDAQALADRLAAGLAKYDVAKVDFTDEQGEQLLTEVIAPLQDHPSEVEAGDVEVNGDRATATLTWRTEVGADTWERETTADLRKAGDGWAVAAAPSIVAPELEEAGDRLRVRTLPAERGRILGGDGQAIVRPRPVMRIGIDKTQVKPAQVVPSARRLAQALEIDVPGYVKQVKAAGPKAFVEAIVLRVGDPEQASTWSDIPGARAVSDRMPLAPTREFARQLLGTVGPVTAEIVEKSDGRLAAGDVAGVSGLQLRYDEQLGGRAGREVVRVPEGEDAEEEELFRVEPENGKDLRITLDQRLQQRADALLADNDSVSALVAIRPSTGEIVAASSGPADNGYNTATFGQYAPGSTFKVVSTLALLRSGLEPDSTVECPAAVTVNGKRFENYDDYPPSGIGRIRFEDALANSCNTAFIAQRDRIKGSALADAAAALGLGVDHDLGFPAYFGQVPEPEGETEAAADLIGQGKVLAAPMTMAAVLASVMKGSTVVPHLLPDHKATAEPDKPLTRAEARTLRRMMQAVVERGSGALLRDLGPGTLAKTGTAEYGEPGPDGDLPTHAWMIGGREDLAVAVFVEKGESGSGTAGPVLKEFLSSAR